MTGLADGVVAFAIALFLNSIVVQLIRRSTPPEEGRFLAKVYWLTITLRAILAVFLNISSTDTNFSVTFWGDSSTYDYRGYQLSLCWAGEVVCPNISQLVSGWGFYYFVGAFYSVFGRNQLLIQLVNGTMGGVTVLVIYGIAARLFDREVARWPALFMAFFPQMVFWSGAMYKDTAIMLCIALCMYCVLQLNETFSLPFLLLFILSSLALMTLRFYVFYIVAGATVGTMFLMRRGGFVRGLFLQAVLVGIFLSIFSFAANKETVERQNEYLDLRRVEISRADQATWGQSAYATQQNVSTTGGALAALPLGLVYLLFTPFPWSVSGLRQLLTLPETLVWYALMPAFARGISFTLRNRFRACLPILVFAATLTVAYAIFQGNVGTAYRQRTQITMFFFVFMGVGLVEKKRAKERQQEGGTLAFQRP